MKWIAYRCIACIFVVLCLIFTMPAMAEAPEVQAGGAALIEVSTTKVLYANNAHVKLPMASTTKIMTALLAIENGELDELVTVPAEAYGVEGSSMYLEKDEKLSLRDLLYGLMLVSGNDAAITIAIHIGGSMEGFAHMMNTRAKELGALNTSFVTPNGLHDPEHYTTAYDLALISAAAMKNPEFQEICGTSYYRTATGNVQRTLKNKNKILWQYEGGNGVKTGFTKTAGKCLVFSAERDGMMLLGVVLNCPNMFPDAMKMLDYGFEHFEMRTLIRAGEVGTRLPVDSGMKNVLEVAAKEDIIIPVGIEGESAAITTRVILSSDLRAPIEIGSEAGRLEVWEGEKLLVSRSLYACNEISERNLHYYIKKLVGRWTA